MRLIALLAFSNALLYAGLLPLWEGFDEPFHYAYAQFIAVTHSFPVLGHATVSEEVRESLALSPVSLVLHSSLPHSISFDDWFRLPPSERSKRIEALRALPSSLRAQPSDLLNYEAQQAPLFYLALAPFEAATARIALPTRILLLRFLVVLVSTALLLYAANLLLSAFNVQSVYRLAALACIFQSQMLWASIAHVTNDAFTIPLATLFIALLARASARRDFYLLAIVFAAGLLLKAYFLAFVPVFLGRLWPLRRRALIPLFIAGLAASWYIRNLVLYRSISGTQETVGGVGNNAAIHALFQINWPKSVLDLFRSSLWTGNWSFVSFSRVTLNLELILFTAGAVLFFVHARRITPGERWAIAACALFFIGVLYQACVTWAATNGHSEHAEPWYLQSIAPCLWALFFLVCQRNSWPGRILATCTVFVSTWIAAATYLAKLFPLYGGMPGRGTPGLILSFWTHSPPAILSDTALAPIWFLFLMLGVFLVALIGTATMVVRNLLHVQRPDAG